MNSSRKPARVAFITGTDTGAGKTLLTAILLNDLRVSGVNALAMKPFCSGGREDAELLNSLQENALSDGEIAPFYYPEPLAPVVSEQKRRRKVTLRAVFSSIGHQKSRCEALLVEGAGGILVPLSENFSVREVVKGLECPVVVAARNRLGVINHTRLTIECLQHVGVKLITVVLMGVEKPDESAKTNQKILQKLLKNTPVFSLPYLGRGVGSAGGVKKRSRNFKKTIALIRESANLSVF